MHPLIELIEKVRSDNPVVVGELGCSTGGTSKILAEHFKTVPGILIIIDWFEGSKVGDEYIVPPGLKDKFVETMKPYEYILLPVESGVAASVLRDGLFDLLWIDADHRYHAIKRDIDLWLPKVRPGGILAGHDYDKSEFKEEFIERDYVEGVHHGVTKAVNERFGIPERIGVNWWVQVK